MGGHLRNHAVQMPARADSFTSSPRNEEHDVLSSLGETYDLLLFSSSDELLELSLDGEAAAWAILSIISSACSF